MVNRRMSPQRIVNMFVYTRAVWPPGGRLMQQQVKSSSPLFLQVEDSSPLVPPSVSMVMPVTVPVQSGGPVKASRSAQRRLRRLSPAGGRSVLYRSLLHRDEEKEAEGGGAHYTPPPMLCPLRAGPGLYCSLTTRRQQRVQTVQLHNTHSKTELINKLTTPLLKSPLRC